MKPLKFILPLVIMAFSVMPLTASRLDTIRVESASMNKKIAVSVVLPDSYGSRELPVVYLLHGFGDNNVVGYLGRTNVRQYADNLDVIIVIPDGDTSWYFDSPIDSNYKYETFVSKELIEYIDKAYLTRADRRYRAVTGLSMGGHGALYLAIRHQDVFGAAGSMSGGVDFRPFPNNWNIKLRLGEETKNQKLWDENTVIGQLPRLENGSLRLIIDCGTEDFFFKVNQALHDALTEKGIAHEFTSRPGNHSWKYWRRSLRDHFLFFKDYFEGVE